MNTNDARDAITAARAAISAHAENARRLTVDAIVKAYHVNMFNAASNLLQHGIHEGIIVSPRRSPLATCTRFNCICPGGANMEDNGICWTYSHAHLYEPRSDADEDPEGDDAAPAPEYPPGVAQGAGDPAPQYQLGPGAGYPAALPGAIGAYP